MKQDFKQEVWPINQLFILIATGLIILYLLKVASDIIVPFLISIAIAIMLSPLFTYLEAKRIPKSVSLIAVMLLSLLPIILLGGYVAVEVKDFAANYQTIKAEFMQSMEKFTGLLQHFGINIDEASINELLQKSNLADILKNLSAQAGNQFSNLFLIFFMVAFMLMESGYFYKKMLKITTEYHSDPHLFIEIVKKVKSYFLIKVKTSLITALLALVVLWYYDISYYYIWAALAFFLNFIPVIGSILAAIPAVAFALIDYDLATAAWVTLWYLIINTVIGNILEPTIMGKGLSLSALVVLLSMIMWGWIFGPAGMILSVPLTMGIQYLFDQYRETKWIALLLSDYK